MKHVIKADQGYYGITYHCDGNDPMRVPIVCFIIEDINEAKDGDPVCLIHPIDMLGEVADCILAPDGSVIEVSCNSYGSIAEYMKQKDEEASS